MMMIQACLTGYSISLLMSLIHHLSGNVIHSCPITLQHCSHLFGIDTISGIPEHIHIPPPDSSAQNRKQLHCILLRIEVQLSVAEMGLGEDGNGRDQRAEALASFTKLGVCKELAATAVDMGWKQPSRIQEEAIPLIVQGGC